MEERKSLIIRVTPETHKELKMTAVSQGMTLQAYALVALLEKLEKDKNK